MQVMVNSDLELITASGHAIPRADNLDGLYEFPYAASLPIIPSKIGASKRWPLNKLAIFGASLEALEIASFADRDRCQPAAPPPRQEILTAPARAIDRAALDELTKPSAYRLIHERLIGRDTTAGLADIEAGPVVVVERKNDPE